MEDVHTDADYEARRLLVAAFQTVPASPTTAGDGLLCAVRRQYAHRRRARVLASAGGAVTAAGIAIAVLLSVTLAAAPSVPAAVTGALSRAESESFRMTMFVTGHNTLPGNGGPLPSLRVTGELDLKRHLGAEALSNGWRTLIVGKKAYTKISPAEARKWNNGKPWTQTLISTTAPPYGSPGAQLAWDFDSDRLFNPQALLTVLESSAQIRDEGRVSGPGWTGTRYRFTIVNPPDTGNIVDSISGTLDVDSQGQIRSLLQTTVFVESGRPGTPGKSIDTARFTFSDFGVRFAVTPPPTSQINPDMGVGFAF